MRKSQAKTGNAIVPRLGLRSSKAAPASAVLDVPSPDAVVLAVPDVPVGVDDVVPGELEDEEIVPAGAELGIDVVKLPDVEPPGATPPDVGLADSELAELDLVAEGVELGDCPELADDAAELDAVELPDVNVANVEGTEDEVAEAEEDSDNSEDADGSEASDDTDDTDDAEDAEDADDDDSEDEEEMLALALLEDGSGVVEDDSDTLVVSVELAVLETGSAEDEDAVCVDRMLMDTLVVDP
jgi:hypothetical protein